MAYLQRQDRCWKLTLKLNLSLLQRRAQKQSLDAQRELTGQSFGLGLTNTATVLSVMLPVLPVRFNSRERLSSDHSKEWKEAADAEFKLLSKNDVWELVEPPPGRNIVGSKWVFRVKYKSDGTIERFKARQAIRRYLALIMMRHSLPLCTFHRFEPSWHTLLRITCLSIKWTLLQPFSMEISMKILHVSTRWLCSTRRRASSFQIEEVSLRFEAVLTLLE